MDIAEAGLEAINTKQAVEKNFLYNAKKQELKIFNQKFDLAKFKRIVCVGFGKAAFEAAAEIRNILGERISCGYVIDLKTGDLGSIISRAGTHPLPSAANVQATEELVQMLKSHAALDTLVICVASGGGSALLCSPYEISLENEKAIISNLTAQGADIFELNAVRKHISRVKGGQLAKALYPSTCLSLIFSDVPGDELGAVASGPTVKDTSKVRQAVEILKKYSILESCQMPSCDLTETPKEEKYFKNVHNILFVSARTALSAMREKAEDLGFEVKIFSEKFEGQARQLGPRILAESKTGQCLLGVGESTVKIIGTGKGGRNQELALAALPYIFNDQVLLTMASDGHDNTIAAGAIVDAGSLLRAGALALDFNAALNNNDSFTFFENLGDQIITGNIGSNVSDFFVCLKK